jgi:VCBS repeat-containing protein
VIYSAGIDTVIGSTQVRSIERIDLLTVGGNDRLTGGVLADGLFGGGGDDVIDGGAGGGDNLQGGAGDDHVIGHEGDLRWGGAGGVDLLQVDFTGRSAAIDFSLLANPGGMNVLAGTEVFGFEKLNLTGGSGADHLGGGNRNDSLSGGDGNDILVGVGGDDILLGGYGDDYLTGGGGDDLILGGIGEDLAVFSGRRPDYRVERVDEDTIRITDIRTEALGGSDRLVSVERFRFADGDLTLEQLLTGNRAPQAIADAATVGENGNVTVNVLSNDLDPDSGDTKTLLLVEPGEKILALTQLPTGEVGFVPGAAFQYLGAGQTVTATASFTMRDAGGLTSSAAINFTVVGANDAPVAFEDQTSVDEDSAIHFNPLLNDNDVDQVAVLSISALGLAGTKGMVIKSADGLLTYDPGKAFQHLKEGETATDSFTYTARDEHGALSTATVTVTIVGRDEPPLPDGPVAVDDQVSIREDQYATVISGLLGNDQGHGLTITSVPEFSAKGALLSLQPDGSVVYDPYRLYFNMEEGQTETDSFSYTVNDAQGRTSTATATITVSGSPDGILQIFVREDETSGNIFDQLTDVAQARWGEGFTLTSVDAAGIVGTLTFDAEDAMLVFAADHDGTTSSCPTLRLP